MKNLMCVVTAVIMIISFSLYGCDGGAPTSPEASGYAQNSLAGSWEDLNGRIYTFDAAGVVTGIEGGLDRIDAFSGSMTVLDAGGNVSGTIHLNHVHADGRTGHAHPIHFSGAFHTAAEIQMTWNVPGAGSGTATWNKVI